MRGNPIIDYNRKGVIANEVSVAISLLSIHKCLNETPHFTRGDNSVVGLKFMTDPKEERAGRREITISYQIG